MFLIVAGAFAAASILAPGSGSRADVRDVGRAGAMTSVDLSVVLRYRNEQELDQLVRLQSDPASPYYAHFLSNAQFNETFAPSQQDYERVAVSLVRAGFTVRGSDNRTILTATATAPIAERYFHTEIHRVWQAGYSGVRYGNVLPAFVPSEIANVTREVLGFDTLTRVTADHTMLPRSSSLTDAIGGKLKGPDGGYGPFAIAAGFDYPVQHGFDGKGHAIGIAIDYDSSDSDLAKFAAYFGTTRTGRTFHVAVDGGAPFDPNNAIETMLDVETAGTLDPGADIYTYDFGSAFTLKDISDAYNKAVADNKVDVVNSSFGLCEDNSPASFNNTVNAITKQGAAKGITFVASTGDYGRGGKCSNRTGQDVPAVLTYFTAVGGVDISVSNAGRITSEPEDAGSGGGPSDIVPIPSYQVGLTGVFSKTKRNLPDVSGPYQPDSFYIGGRFAGPIGGTSWAAPATAAFIAERNEVRKSRLGYANPALYAVFAKNGYNVFNDITSGNNGIACVKGYDDCSGIGTLKGYPLARLL